MISSIFLVFLTRKMQEQYAKKPIRSGKMAVFKSL